MSGLRASGLLLQVVCSLFVFATGGAAQDKTSYRHQARSAHGHGTVVAVVLRLPTGTQDDPVGLEGTAVLVARVLKDQAARALDPATTVVTVEVERTTTVVTLLTLPDGWQRDWGIVDSVLFRAPLDVQLLDAHRSELMERLIFEDGSPVLDFERESMGLFAEPGSPWARPVRGTLASVAAVDATTLDGYRSSFYRPELAAMAIAGPVEMEAPGPEAPDTVTSAADSLESELDSVHVASDSVATPQDPTRVTATRTREAPWSAGRRVDLVRDVTSTWIMVGYPVPPEVPQTHLELVAHLLLEELDPVPPDPDRYDITVRVDETPRGSMLLIQATVFPEAADRWEGRILGAVARMAGTLIGEDFFRWRRRRFRTARLLDQSAPEAEAARITADLLREGRVRELDLEIWGLNAAAFQAAAASLGEPRIFLYGPDLGQSGFDGPSRPAPGAGQPRHPPRVFPPREVDGLPEA